MTKTITRETHDAHTVSKTIFTQISRGVQMSLGMHNPTVSSFAPDDPDTYAPGLGFLARVLPFRKDGRRGSSVRVMRVTVTLTAADLYDIDVRYAARRSVVGDTVHCQMKGIDAESLSRALLAIDYDGPTAFNPRMI